MILKPGVLGPFLRVEFNCLNTSTVQDFVETCTRMGWEQKAGLQHLK